MNQGGKELRLEALQACWLAIGTSKASRYVCVHDGGEMKNTMTP